MAMMKPTQMMNENHPVEVQVGHHNLNMDSGTSPKKKGSVQVKLELGHKAITRKKPTTEGFTHDWTMFVRGPEGSNIQHFVDRVVFFLHESFPKPKRVVKEPPYQVNESGYAGFNLPIEIYFKNKDDPKKITFSYDLFLHTPNSPPVNHVRCEKLTFQNPSEEFRRKLVKAGGMAILGPNDPSQPPTLQTCPSPAQASTPESKAFADLFGAPSKGDGSQKKHKSHSSKDRSGGRSKSSSSSQGSSVSPSSAPAAGTPPSAATTPPTTPSKEPKTSSSQTKASKEKAAKRPAEQGSADMSKKKRKDNNGESVERSKEREEKKERDKQEKEEKEKEKKDKEKERKKEKKSSSKESKSKHKSSKKDASKSTKGEEIKGTVVAKPSSSPLVAPPSPPSPPSPPPAVQPPQPQGVKTVAAKKGMPLAEELSPGEISPFDDDPMEMDLPPEVLAAACSPASTLSFSSMKGPSGVEGGGPLGALFAEMEDEEVPLSPLPVTSDSPPPPSRLPPPGEKAPKVTTDPDPAPRGKPPSPPADPVKAPPAKTKKKDKESRRSRSDRRTKEASKENKDTTKDTTNTSTKTVKDVIAKDLFRDYRTEGKENGAEDKSAPTGRDCADLGERDVNNMQPGGAVVAPNGESLNVLLELQRRLMGMTDRDLVQQVVNVIEETGMYKISDATFDFDLCSLDINTVKKLQVCLEMAC